MGVRAFFASDIRFYYGVGVVIILIFITVLATASTMGSLTFDRRLVPLVVGFFMFMFVYFISVLVLRLKPEDS